MNVPLTNNCGQGCFDEVRRWLISQNILIMIVTGTAMSLQVSQKYLYFMLILVYFASDFQHNSNIVYVRPDKQNYLWTFCLILELYIGTLVLWYCVLYQTRNIHYMHAASYSSLLLDKMF